jgi:hypothetical protein
MWLLWSLFFYIFQGIELLKASLLSKDALTAVFLKQKVRDVASRRKRGRK